MASREMRRFLLSSIFFSVFLLHTTICLEAQRLYQSNSIAKTMDQKMSGRNTILRRKRHTETSNRHRRDSDDKTCDQQEHTFLDNLSKEHFSHAETFENETKFSMSLSWAGENKGIILVTVTEERFFIFAGMSVKPSTLYRSDDGGKSFKNISSQIKNDIIRKDNGLQKNPIDPNHIVLVTHVIGKRPGNSIIWTTRDAGISWTSSKLPIVLYDLIVFHPKISRHMLIRDKSNKALYISNDYGILWKKIHKKVTKFKWDTETEKPGYNGRTIYVTYDPAYAPLPTFLGGILSVRRSSQLMRSDDMGDTWTKLVDNVWTFGSQGKFLYVSVVQKNAHNKRVMKVSTDSGHTWNDSQLPTITPERFYSILDMSEGVIFMHVDNPGDTGHGTLYTSDADGVVFTTSLVQHLYPNYQDLTDFYKVVSMRGTYMASQITKDKSIHSMITFDRGAKWQPIKAPPGATCKTGKTCSLQIVGPYSLHRGVRGQLPLSSEAAPGLILVHAHVADSMQTSPPSVYITSDGGYNWIKSLDGPHHYQIADHGGLLVAVPSDTITPTVVKFSTDEGRCWHHYTFTNDSIIFTGLLTEPGSKAMDISIWGYTKETREWKVHTFNITKIIPNKCSSADYEQWTVHKEINGHMDDDYTGCLLGTKETIMKLKKDSWCYNGYIKEMHKISEKCKCRNSDYYCAFGYVRRNDLCVIDPNFKGNEKRLNLCLQGHVAREETSGWLKIPGDNCTGGVDNEKKVRKTTYIDLSKACGEGASLNVIRNDMNKAALDKMAESNRLGGSDKAYNYNDAMNEKIKKDHKNSTVVAVVVVAVTSLVVIALLVGYRKFKQIRERRRPTYRYTSLASDADFDAEIEQALGTSSLYEDTSDEELVLKNKNKKKKTRSYHDDSDVDIID